MKYRPIPTFLVITFALSSIFYFFIIHTGKIQSGFNMYVTGLMWCPGVAALITNRLLKRNIAGLGWGWGNPRYQWQSYFIPILYALIAYVLIWTFGWGRFYDHDFLAVVSTQFGFGHLSAAIAIPIYIVLTGVYGMVRHAGPALGEEIGWRGFLVPELFKKFNYTQTSIITGLIWGCWHIPILVFADYNSGTPVWYGLSCFIFMVICISFIFTWYRLKSNSLWTGVILHSSHNLFIQLIFTPLTKSNGSTKYFIDEFGIVLSVVCLLFAKFFWRKRAELKKQAELV